ncbi:MAG: prepilin-type N-terminal cleavage/methylation domain-containing protein [Candidatus Omnitrophica bacterium]|nr:prepilin-type N-terminal cleavage/methylation domain-containing protein [Candidatus Omnitrophota bacterium]
MGRGFTLLELIVVIVILGILATLGYTQYTKVVERGRQAEARAILGDIRKFAYDYWFKNGTVTGMANADVNIGTSADQIPSSCRNTHYFRYQVGGYSEPYNWYDAYRCTADGKTPNWSSQYYVSMGIDWTTGAVVLSTSY